MNKRLIELYTQAAEFAYKVCQDEGREGGTSDHIWNTISTGKFAELIVQECAIIGEQYADGNYEVSRQILAHFGMDEEDEE